MRLGVYVGQRRIILQDESSSGGMVTKTCTYEPRNGNEEPRYWHNENLSINSMGLPNEGLESYLSMSNFVAKPYFYQYQQDVQIKIY